MNRLTGVMLPVLLGAGVLLLPTQARADARIRKLPWDTASQVLEYRTCGCADSCWIAELRSKKSRKLIAKLRCDCYKLWASEAADTQETEYRADCDGFDTEEKSARIAAELKVFLESRKKAKP